MEKIKNFFSKKIVKSIIIALPIIAIIVLIIVFGFSLKEVDYSSDLNRFTREEVKQYLDTHKIDNSFTFWLKSKISFLRNDIDLFEDYEVKLKSPGKVEVVAHERVIEGFIKDKTNNYYFDKSGEVLKVSSEKCQGVPKVKGLEYERIGLYQKIKVTKKEKLNALLELATAIKEYGYDIKTLYVNDFLEVGIKIRKLKVEFGKTKNLQRKLAVFSDMYPKLKEKNYKGVLDMKFLNTDGKYIIKQTKKKKRK